MKQMSRTNIVYVQLIYIANLIFDSSSAYLVHESSSRVNYRIEFRNYLRLTQDGTNGNTLKQPKKS
jgi:hypothetical protein